MAIVQDPTHPTGVVDTSPKGSSAGARARERKAMAALELRKRNVGWPDIAETLGFPSGRHAQTAVETTLADCFDEESQDLLRRLAAAHLEDMLFALRAKAMDPENAEQLGAINQRRQLIETHMKLLGYARPTEVAIYNPLDSEISEFVAATIRKESAGKKLAESDIFDMEEDEDGTYVMPEREPEPEAIEESVALAEVEEVWEEEHPEVEAAVTRTLSEARGERERLDVEDF